MRCKFMNVKNRIKELYDSEDMNPLYLDQLMGLLDIEDQQRSMLEDVLEEMVEDGELVKTRKGKYALPSTLGMLVGRIQGNPKGYGFFIPDDKGMDDVFISPEHMNSAMHNDRVLIRLLSKRGYDGLSREGDIVKILERANKTVVGTLERDRGFGFVIPDDSKISNDIFLPANAMGDAKTGHKVVVEITKWPLRRRNPEGKVIEILGHKDDAGTDILSIIRQFDLPGEFSKDVVLHAEDIARPVKEDEVAKRLDLRELSVFTIDGEDAKDFDDAVSIEKLSNGNYKLGVHIADVTHYVKDGSVIDIEAYKRGTSINLVDRVIPMLPQKLSNGICSLNPNEDKLAVSVFMEIDNKGNVINHSVHESIICSKARMIYDHVTYVLEAENVDDLDNNIFDTYIPYIDELKLMEELCGILNNKRKKRGSIDFDTQETRIDLDDDGKPISIFPEQRGISNRIIEEFMIVTNETIAEYMHWGNIPSIFRIHEEPDRERVEEFNRFIYNFGYHLKGVGSDSIHPKVFQELLDGIKGKKEERIINDVALRAMKKAIYSPDSLGHFGLASKFYCHFTSPIRRYPDLMVHRILKEVIHGELDGREAKRLEETLPNIANHCSKRERIAEEAERETSNLKKCEYMLDKIGWRYSGIISGVTNYGIYVQLPNTIEGFVAYRTIDYDYYIYDEKNYCAVGERTRMVYRLGDAIDIKVQNVDMSSRNIDFVIAES